MKKLAIFLLIFSFAGCKKGSENSTGNTDYEISFVKWNSYKITVHNSYSYITFFYVPIGINPTYNETKITVQNGSIIGREYSTRSIVNTTGPVQSSYIETKSDLGTHAEGAELLTMDDIYTKAKNVWLKADPSHGPGILETNNNGLISRCGYTITSAYNNFVGIEIKSVTPL